MLELTNLDVFYGGIHALRGVNLNVQDGEFVALIGANGAGKTTLLRTVSGLKRPSGGSLKFNGQELSAMPPERVVTLGLSHCPEGRHVWKHMTVRENLMLGAYARRGSREVGKDLQRVYTIFPKLNERQRQAAGTLSGGEQQMLAVGRALMGAPKLLLLDEPSLGLAPVVVQELARVFNRINGEGTTILLVEQNASMALRLAARTYVLETGAIVKEGSSEKLLDDPSIRDAYLGGKSFKAGAPA
ncbi:MAG TPA: ABC transporter ATP-binding protein [Bacillota bacterium]|jgi:branched-chain amino acid transport system ATP-binding protein